MNELSKEKSPYLLQHKNNPVWWKSWGANAFTLSQREKKPIFLSIGYATCHWCHVMESECFEDQDVAKYLNENFIAIKVDREELPDVDQIYMDSLHALGQRGGWPLNIFLTPELKPFYGGTYFPKPNFIKLLIHIASVWKNENEKIEHNAKLLVDFLEAQSKQYQSQNTLTQDVFKKFLDNSWREFDQSWGGFGGAPKFPPNTQLTMISRLTRDPAFKNEKTLLILEKSLQRIIEGGIYDHIGGGLSRYAVDEEWLIPHFEKMLYVNALTVSNLVDCYQITKKSIYLSIARDILDYVQREMLSSQSGFFSAEDADSAISDIDEHKEEGAFYVWNYEELKKHLDSEEVQWLKDHLGLTPQGNFEGKTCFRINTDELEKTFLSEKYQNIRNKLYQIRESRPRPLLDDKQLTSWNGLMIKAFAQMYRVTKESPFLNSALQAAEFCWTELHRDGKLHRRYRDGETRFEGTLEDYAYLASGYIELYQCDFDEKWLLRAKTLTETQISEFWDTSSAGFFYTSKNEKHLLVRTKDFGDNALPNPNGVAAANLHKLSRYFGRPEWLELAQKTIMCCSELAGQHPMSFATVLASAFEIQSGLKELVFIQSSKHWHQIEGEFLPELIIGKAHPNSLVSALKMNISEDKEIYYLCQNGACDAPTENWQEVFDRIVDPKGQAR